MALVVHIHADVHYHIHLIMRRTHIKGLMTTNIKDPDRMYYDNLPGAHVIEDTDTTYQVHLRYHMHVHVYPNSF